MLAACKNDPKEIDALTSRRRLDEDRAVNVTMIYSEKGKVKARLKAAEFVRREAAKPPYTDFNNGIQVEFYNDSLQLTSTLTARYARYYEQQGNVLVRDNIVIVNSKGEKLKTEELVWNQQSEKFYTEKEVTLILPTQTLWGTGMQANQDFTWYRITKPKGRFDVEQDRLP